MSILLELIGLGPNTEDDDKAMANSQLTSTKRIIAIDNMNRKNAISSLNRLRCYTELDQNIIIKIKKELSTICESYLYKIYHELSQCISLYSNVPVCNLALQDLLINYKKISIQDFSDTRLAGFNSL